MIALDTNVIARFMVEDDPVQMRAARRLIDGLTEDRPGFICREVLIELVWLLESVYRLPRRVVGDVVDQLLCSSTVVIEADDAALLALEGYVGGTADFADLMILAAARAAECEALYTFDRKLSRQDGAIQLETT